MIYTNRPFTSGQIDFLCARCLDEWDRHFGKYGQKWGNASVRIMGNSNENRMHSNARILRKGRTKNDDDDDDEEATARIMLIVWKFNWIYVANDCCLNARRRNYGTVDWYQISSWLFGCSHDQSKHPFDKYSWSTHTALDHTPFYRFPTGANREFPPNEHGNLFEFTFQLL